MKRSRFLKIVGLGALAAPVAGTAVFQALEAITKTSSSDQLILDAIQSMINEPSGPSEIVLHTGVEGMKAFDAAMKEMAEFTKEKEYQMMYNL